MRSLKLDKNKHYLLACSFGPDSMALFHLLYTQGYKFDCAIVNYHLRKESDFEVASLLKYATNFSVKVHVKNVTENINKNIEAKCREIRYSFFKELCQKLHYDTVLVAHHQDDLIETYLLQKNRQNCPIFYGIKQETVIQGVNIVRPLLEYSKRELLEICDSNEVPYSIDQSNFDIRIKRNKIRHEIVSKMSLLERNKIIDQINEENNKLFSLLDSIDKQRLCEVGYILSLNEISVIYALNLMIKKMDDSLYLSKANVGQCISILKSKKPNGQFSIKTGVYLIKEYDHYDFSLKKLTNNEFEFILSRPGKLDTEYFYLDFSEDATDRNVSKDDYPLTIRHIKKDDFVFINGYKVSAGRLMIDWKVPYRKRLIWPIIINKDNKSIYIPRYRKDFKPNPKINFYVK